MSSTPGLMDMAMCPFHSNTCITSNATPAKFAWQNALVAILLHEHSIITHGVQYNHAMQSFPPTQHQPGCTRQANLFLLQGRYIHHSTNQPPATSQHQAWLAMGT